MSFKEFRLDAKSAGAQALDSLWGPGPPGDLLYDMSAKGRGRGNHASRVGTGNVWTPSERGMVAQYNGTDDGFNSEFSLPIGLLPFSVMAWVWLDSTVVSTQANIIGEGSLGAGEWLLRVALSDVGANAKLAFYGDAGGMVAAGANGTFPRDVWTHAAATRSAAGILALYQNGVLLGTDATAADNLASAGVLTIGNANGVALRWWKGMIDDVRYYSRALSIGQIAHIYEATRWTPYTDIAKGPIRRYGSARRQWGHVRRKARAKK